MNAASNAIKAVHVAGDKPEDPRSAMGGYGPRDGIQYPRFETIEREDGKWIWHIVDSCGYAYVRDKTGYPTRDECKAAIVVFWRQYCVGLVHGLTREVTPTPAEQREASRDASKAE